IQNVNELRIAQIGKLQGLDEVAINEGAIHIAKGYDNQWVSGDKISVNRTNGRITILERGWYHVEAQIRFAFHSIGRRSIYIVLNSTTEIAYSNVGATNNATVSEKASSGPYLFKKGDYVEMRVQHVLTTSNTLIVGGAKNSSEMGSDLLSVRWLGRDG